MAHLTSAARVTSNIIKATSDRCESHPYYILHFVAHDVPVVVLGVIDLQDTFSFFGHDNSDLKRFIHAQTMHTFAGLIISHIGAALVHQFWVKDGLLRRILWEKSNDS